jgi:hypothetical protein
MCDTLDIEKTRLSFYVTKKYIFELDLALPPI